MIDIKQLSVEKVENIIGIMPMRVPKLKAEVSFTKYVQLFDNNRYYINIYIIKANSLIIRGSVSIYIDRSSTNYAYIYGLFVNLSKRKRGYATQLILEAEKIIKKLDFTGSYLQVNKNSWVLDWYKKLGYINDDEHETDECYQLYKDFKDNN